MQSSTATDIAFSPQAQLVYCLRFQLKVSVKNIQLLQNCGDIAELPASVCRTGQIPAANYQRYQQAKTLLTTAAFEKQMVSLQEQGIGLLCQTDEHYPELLKQITDPPLLLFYRGDRELFNAPQLAIVGARKPTRQGTLDATAFSAGLAAGGFVVTSGMAAGIDGAAHKGALQQGGKTVAVLGCGIDVCYPRRHQSLMTDIIRHGLVVSEYPPGAAAIAGQFPRRNRIVTGMSLGVLVVEAGLQSGSLISARLAMEQGREVFAIPGSIHNPVSRGCHQLIKQGAVLTENIEDMLAELKGWSVNWQQLPQDQPKAGSKLNPIDLPKPLMSIINVIGYNLLTVQDILPHVNMPIEELLANLMELELLGIVENQNGCYQYVNHP